MEHIEILWNNIEKKFWVEIPNIHLHIRLICRTLYRIV